MKLPSDVNLPVQRVSNMETPGQAASVALAKTNVLNSALGLADDIGQAVNKAQRAEASAGLHNAVNEWEQYHNSKLEYDPDELDSEIASKVKTTELVFDPVTGGTTEQKRMVPKGEVYPYMYDKMVKGVIGAYSDKIVDPMTRTQWKAEFTQRANETVNKQVIQSINIRRDEMNTNLLVQSNAAVQAQNWDMAHAMVDSMELVGGEKASLHAEINEKREQSFYYSAVAENDLSAIDESLEFLRQEEYHKSGVLDPKSRAAWEDKLTNARKALVAKVEGANTEYARLLNDELSTMATELEAGTNFDPGAISELVTRATAASNAGLKVNPVSLWNIEKSLVLNKTLASDAGLPLQVRLQLEKETKNKPAGSASEGEFNRKRSIGLGKMNTLQLRNFTEYANQYGLVQLSSVVGPSSLSELEQTDAERFQKRMEDMDAVGQTQGIKVKEYLLDNEVTALKTAWEGADVLGKNNFVRQIQEGMGNKTNLALQQIFESDESSSLITAEMLASGKAHLAEAVLIGNEIRVHQKISGTKVETRNKDVPLEKYLREQVGQVYMFDQARKNRLVQATMSLVAYRAEREGADPSSPDTVRGALDAVTGGLIEFNGKQIAPSRTGQTPEDLQTFFENTTPDYLEQFGGIAGYENNEMVWDRITNGVIQLHDYGHNQYALYDTQRGTYVSNRAGVGIKISINENTSFTRPSASRLNDAARRAAVSTNFERFGLDKIQGQEPNAYFLGSGAGFPAVMQKMTETEGVFQLYGHGDENPILKGDGEPLLWDSNKGIYK